MYSQRATTSTHAPRWRRMVGAAALVLVVALAVLLFSLYQASRHVPEFYQQVLAADRDAQREQGYELERRALELHNKLALRERTNDNAWEAAFTQDQINGWLAVDLVEKFPGLLPPDVREPRVDIGDNEVQVACHYEGESLHTVISLTLSVALADEPNTIAVRVKRARAGALPIPLNQFLDEITKAAHDGGVDLRWTQQGGDPVALIRIPTETTDLPGRVLKLKSLVLKRGEVSLSGETTLK